MPRKASQRPIATTKQSSPSLKSTPAKSANPPSSLKVAVPPQNTFTSTWAPAVNLEREKKKKKKKSGGRKALDFLRGAAKVAAQVAPAVLPLLLAGHAPTNLAAKAAGVPGVPDLTSAGTVGVANAVSVAKYATGTYVPTYRTSGSRVTGVSWPGCEELASIGPPASGNIWRAGDVMAKISLNPASPDWAGTQIQVQSRLWTRFRLSRLSVMYQPAVATTTAGQMVGFCSEDPDQPWSFSGNASIKAALAHQFSDIFNTWSVGCVGIATDSRSSDKYTQGDGSDPRLTSPGDFYLVCSADIDMTSIDTLGTIVVAYEFDFDVRSDLDTSYAPGAGFVAEWAPAWNTAAQGAYSYIGDGASGIQQPSSWLGPLASLVKYENFVIPTGTTVRGFTLPAGVYQVHVYQTTAGSGTNGGATMGMYTSWNADNVNKFVKATTGAFMSVIGQQGYTQSASAGLLGTVRTAAGACDFRWDVIVASDVPFSIGFTYLFTTQTGIWTNGLTSALIMQIQSDIFTVPTVSELSQVQTATKRLAEENRQLEDRVSHLADLVSSLMSPVPAPHVDTVWSRFLAAGANLTPDERAAGLAAVSSAATTYTAQ